MSPVPQKYCFVRKKNSGNFHDCLLRFFSRFSPYTLCFSSSCNYERGVKWCENDLIPWPASGEITFSKQLAFSTSLKFKRANFIYCPKTFIWPNAKNEYIPSPIDLQEHPFCFCSCWIHWKFLRGTRAKNTWCSRELQPEYIIVS